jgi:hypothetical protein
VITYVAEYVIDTTKINVFERFALGADGADRPTGL